MDPKVRTGYINARSAVTAGLNALTRLDHMPAREQIAGVMVMYAVICQRLGMHPMDTYERACAYLRDGDIAREVSALRDYVDGELR